MFAWYQSGEGWLNERVKQLPTMRDLRRMPLFMQETLGLKAVVPSHNELGEVIMYRIRVEGAGAGANVASLASGKEIKKSMRLVNLEKRSCPRALPGQS